MTKVINFFGGPSAGKSTHAGELFGWMKRQRINCEYVQEFAKDLTWEKNMDGLDDQFYVFGEQHHRQYRLLGQVDYIITDSPLILSNYYYRLGGSKHRETPRSFLTYVADVFNLFDNVNFFVERGARGFVQAGRNQNEVKSKEIDVHLLSLLGEYAIPFRRVSTLAGVLKELKFAS